MKPCRAPPLSRRPWGRLETGLDAPSNLLAFMRQAGFFIRQALCHPILGGGAARHGREPVHAVISLMNRNFNFNNQDIPRISRQ